MLRAWRAVTGGHQSVFAAHGADKVASADLVAKLVATEDGPWSEVNHGRPLTAPTLARLLRPFGISPGTVRFDSGATPKGYKQVDFADAWTRYLRDPPTEPPHRHNPQKAGTSAHSKPPQSADDVAAGKAEKPRETATCGGVAAEATPPSDRSRLRSG